MTYNLKYSDPNKATGVRVPDMPPGINTADTSLSLIGKGYPNYGQATAQNFLNLLENFAGPIPPQNPIEGQLWYDTSDPLNKKLRIMDGSATAARWPSANGIYQQGIDPKATNTVSLKAGDIWVDTVNNQLKIYSAGNWSTVGPSTSTNTGAVVATIPAAIGGPYNVILNKSNGTIVSIISDTAFTPNPVIAGFSSVQVGITLNSTSKITGLVDRAQQLLLNSGTVIPSDNFLRKDDSTIHGQTITGNLYFSTPSNQAGAANRDGIVINVAGQPYSEYIQFYKDITTAGLNSAVIANNRATGNIVLRIGNSGIVTVGSQQVTVATSLTVNSGTTVVGILTATNIVAINNITVSGNSLVKQNFAVAGISTVSGTLTVGTPVGSGTAIVPATTGTYDIGSSSNPFRTVYAQTVYASNYNSASGTLQLWAGSTSTNKIPSGWKVCDGTTATTSTYVGLFSVIGYQYGKWNNGEAMYLPNLAVSSPIPGGTTATYYIIKI
jgi:hypothetical protein